MNTPRKMTADLIARLRVLWDTGRPHCQIAAELGIADSTLRKQTQRMGLFRRRPNNPMTDEHRKIILRMRGEGYRVMQIARFLNRHHRQIGDVLNLNRNAPGRSARLAARPDPSTSPHRALTGRITPEIAVRGAQTTHLLRSAIKRRTIPIGPPPRQCQYPTGERPYTFCLAPVVPGRPYCCEHTARCYVKVKPMAVVPAKPKEPFVEFKW